ncbi:metallophosphoesterase family protein [Flexithrix dorotheae]|uniref:metallophosphoesterase family protein n=1 Tax=Flexithrix dorotheae TaxID=70993 RepID=UPI00037DA839|nr:metallophosphoesterase [Flexithrix dorotheae]
MPGVVYNSSSRRKFLISSAKFAGIAALASPINLLGQQKADYHHLALLSDTHIPADETESYRDFFPVKNFGKVVGEVLAQKPELSIINGDLARLTGEKADYEKFSKLLKPVSDVHPVLMTLGNHDHRENFHEAFAQEHQGDLKDKHALAFELDLISVIILDSLMFVNKTPGFLGEKQREWLEDHLKTSADKPTFIFVHHTLNESDGALLDYDRLFKIILPYKKVKAIFHGHAHQYQYDKMEDIHVIGQPGIGYNFSDDQPVGWLDAKISKTSGEFTLRAIAGNLEENGKTVKLDWR